MLYLPINGTVAFVAGCWREKLITAPAASAPAPSRFSSDPTPFRIDSISDTLAAGIRMKGLLPIEWVNLDKKSAAG
ncbi:MAG: hypothetical protein V4550_17605, partial [Gemmatimonadota bacterium]